MLPHIVERETTLNATTHNWPTVKYGKNIKTHGPRAHKRFTIELNHYGNQKLKFQVALYLCCYHTFHPSASKLPKKVFNYIIVKSVRLRIPPENQSTGARISSFFFIII